MLTRLRGRPQKAARLQITSSFDPMFASILQRLLPVPRGLSFVADTLIVIGENLVRGPIARILLQGTIEPAQALFGLAAAQENHPGFMAESGIMGLFHDLPRH